MEQLFILLLVGAFALMKWALKGGQFSKPEDSSQEPTTARPSQGRGAAGSEEERMRKFMEALGIPTSSAPPPKVAPRTEAPKRPLAPVRPPLVLFPDIQRPSKREQTRPRPRPRSARETTPPRQQAPPPPQPPPLARTERAEPSPRPLTDFPEAMPAAAEFPGAETAAPVARESASQPADIRALLRSPASLRSAIILREVLGPPRGLQPDLQSAGH
jgi:hypothetical protein